MIVTGYVSSMADGRTPTANVTGASDVPLEFWMRYENENAPVNPVLGVNANEPSLLTWSDPPVPKVTVAPAALLVTVPPSVPPPKEATLANGDPRTSFASSVGVVPPDVSGVL